MLGRLLEVLYAQVLPWGDVLAGNHISMVTYLCKINCSKTRLWGPQLCGPDMTKVVE